MDSSGLSPLVGASSINLTVLRPAMTRPKTTCLFGARKINAVLLREDKVTYLDLLIIEMSGDNCRDKKLRAVRSLKEQQQKNGKA
jgi:hypothetical protein